MKLHLILTLLTILLLLTTPAIACLRFVGSYAPEVVKLSLTLYDNGIPVYTSTDTPHNAKKIQCKAFNKADAKFGTCWSLARMRISGWRAIRGRDA